MPYQEKVWLKFERKGAYAGAPIEDVSSSNISDNQFNYTGATYYWVAF